MNGATVRLRTSDGILFTRAGSRKLGFFVGKDVIEHLGREQPPAVAVLPTDLSEQIRRELPGSRPSRTVRRPAGRAHAARTAGIARTASIGQRPLAGPVLALLAPPLSPGGVLLRGRAFMPSTEMGILVEQAFAYGRPPPAKPGRADDFAWPRRPVDRSAMSQVIAPVSAAASSRP